MAFHNRPNYGYRFILKELAEKFEKQLTCLEESTETCLVPIEKHVTRIGKNEQEITKAISYG